MCYTYTFQVHLIEKPRSEIYLHVICIYHFAEKLDSVKWSRRVLMNPGRTSPNGGRGRDQFSQATVRNNYCRSHFVDRLRLEFSKLWIWLVSARAKSFYYMSCTCFGVCGELIKIVLAQMIGKCNASELSGKIVGFLRNKLFRLYCERGMD